MEELSPAIISLKNMISFLKEMIFSSIVLKMILNIVFLEKFIIPLVKLKIMIMGRDTTRLIHLLKLDENKSYFNKQ